MSASESAAADAVPNADSAQRPLVIRLARVRSPSPVKRMKARSLARPGLGRYQAGQLDPVGVDPLHVDHAAPEVALLAAAAEHEDLAAPASRARPASSGSATIRVTAAELGLARDRAVGRISTATAPSRLSAATTESPLGRVLISTPTCSPWRTPSESRPRTTLSTRRLTASCA